MTPFKLQPLPPPIDLDTKAILKKLPDAHRHLAELKGIAATIPNESILIQTLGLQEAKDSSEIENIVTTHDDLFKAQLADESVNASAKEVAQYAEALRVGFESVRTSRLITLNQILEIQATLERNDAGFRKLPGTALRNRATGEVVYTPPQDHARILELMSDLESFINDPARLDVDPLVKMALIHYQFESIHPFYDGNGRTGRIINILYLVANDLLNLPVLYLSRFIIQNKPDYYRLLQEVRTRNAWEEWVLFMLEGIATTARQTIDLIGSIRTMMMDYKHRIRAQFPRIYSQDLLNNLFRHPYTKIAILQKELSVSRLTATRYLDKLVAAGFLEKHRHGRSNYYLNVPLVNLFLNLPRAPELDPESQIESATEAK
ncbi:MAG: Fic family protein [Candidatus Marinimicrobia bacterium]|nr:Fic family protein [Candidatus Neomarinimicrobiota bacterium]